MISACIALGLVIRSAASACRCNWIARARPGCAAVDSVRAVLRILIVFALTTPFWALFDQKASTWVLQGQAPWRCREGLWWWPGWLVKGRADAGPEPAARSCC